MIIILGNLSFTLWLVTLVTYVVGVDSNGK